MTHPTPTASTGASPPPRGEGLVEGGHQPEPHKLLPLELTLWRGETRYNRALMDATFAPDFHEFGRSGRRYSRDDLLFDPADAKDIDATLHDYTVTPLAPTLAHCTYISELRTPKGTEWANRSSLWDRSSGQWQLRFHQGTALTAAQAQKQLVIR